MASLLLPDDDPLAPLLPLDDPGDPTQQDPRAEALGQLYAQISAHLGKTSDTHGIWSPDNPVGTEQLNPKPQQYLSNPDPSFRPGVFAGGGTTPMSQEQIDAFREGSENLYNQASLLGGARGLFEPGGVPRSGPVALTSRRPLANPPPTPRSPATSLLPVPVDPAPVVSPAERFWDAFDEAHAASPHSGVSHMKFFQHGPSEMEISHIQVDPSMRGQGIGNSIMENATTLADQHGVTLHASPASDADGAAGLDADALREWYERWGFDTPGGGDRLTRFPATGQLTDQGRARLNDNPALGFDTGGLSGGGLLGSLKAYHGSPHAFDAFSDHAIGTGEGAQAYGYGHYVAENEGVARGYRDQLAGKAAPFEWNGQPVPPGKPVFDLIDQLTEQDWRLGKIAEQSVKYGPRNAIDSFEPNTRNKSDGPAWQAAMDKFKEGAGEGAPGYMYEVNVAADPEKFLHWDKPLSEQHPDVQAALRTIEPYRLRDDMSFAGFPSPRGPTGGEYLKDLAGMAPEDAAAALHKAGIPGIRYLDQGSRGAGEGSHNAVVFDPKLLEIIRRYGIAGLLGGAAAGTAGSQKDDQ